MCVPVRSLQVLRSLTGLTSLQLLMSRPLQELLLPITSCTALQRLELACAHDVICETADAVTPVFQARAREVAAALAHVPEVTVQFDKLMDCRPHPWMLQANVQWVKHFYREVVFVEDGGSCKKPSPQGCGVCMQCLAQRNGVLDQ